MTNQTTGTVTSVKKQWWLKINTKAVRTYWGDGATFPHIITVSYTAGGQEYTKRKWVKASLAPPCIGDTVRVIYDQDKPAKAKISL